MAVLGAGARGLMALAYRRPSGRSHGRPAIWAGAGGELVALRMVWLRLGVGALGDGVGISPSTRTLPGDSSRPLGLRRTAARRAAGRAGVGSSRAGSPVLLRRDADGDGRSGRCSPPKCAAVRGSCYGSPSTRTVPECQPPPRSVGSAVLVTGARRTGVVGRCRARWVLCGGVVEGSVWGGG